MSCAFNFAFADVNAHSESTTTEIRRVIVEDVKQRGMSASTNSSINLIPLYANIK